MSELNFENELGHLHVQGWRAPFMQAAAEFGLELARQAKKVSRAALLQGERVWIKGGPLLGRARLRHGLRRLFLRARAPRIQEYFNHSWLIERHFQCALPLAAGVLTRGGWPIYQYFVSAEIPAATPLLLALETNAKCVRAPWLAELAREVARMHALGFVHHDLYLRNVLVTTDTDRALHWLDAWRGGPAPQLRSPAYDLACLFLEGSTALDEAEQQALFVDYLRERSRQGHPASAPSLARSIRRMRAKLLSRLAREPGRQRGRALPPLAWHCLAEFETNERALPAAR